MRIDAIDNAVIAPDELANVFAWGFGYLSAAFGKPSQLSHARESVANPFLFCVFPASEVFLFKIVETFPALRLWVVLAVASPFIAV